MAADPVKVSRWSRSRVAAGADRAEAPAPPAQAVAAAATADDSDGDDGFWDLSSPAPRRCEEATRDAPTDPAVKVTAGVAGKESAAPGGYCRQCWAAGGLSPDPKDGSLYCAACWEAWSQPPHSVGSSGRSAVAGRGARAARAGQQQQQQQQQQRGRAQKRGDRATEGGYVCDVRAAQRGDGYPPKHVNGGHARVGPAGNSAHVALRETAEALPASKDEEADQSSSAVCKVLPETAPAPVVQQTPTGVSYPTEQPPTPAAPPLETAAMRRFAEEVAKLRRAHPEVVPEADEQQNEELDMLTAIYGESLHLDSREGGRLRTLHLELPVECGDGCHVDIFVRTEDGDVPAGSVQALPPAQLCFALPGDYPLEGGGVPALLVKTHHLEADAHEALEEELRALATSNAGEPRLFDLVSLFQERLEPPARLLLPELGGMDAALRLLAHNRRAQEARRKNEVKSCPLCFEDLAGVAGLFLTCGHFGCRACLSDMARLHVGESNASALRCPYPDCREPFDFETVKALLGANSPELAKWEELSLKACLEHMEDVVFCPRCDDNGDGNRVPCIKEEDDMATCEACRYIFCGRCRGVFHPGRECASMEDKLDALEARAAGSGAEAKAAKAELMTLRHLAKTSKRCPRCEMVIEKIEGCSKVKCGSCSTTFCWRCGKEITGYDHFATSECRLFDDEEIRRWNQRVHAVDKAQARAHEARFLAQFVDPEELWKQARECPRCKTMVVREGKNNHLRCHSCLTQFCACCYTVLPKKSPGDHFQKDRICPQHSD